MAETKEELIIEINVEGSVNQLGAMRQELDELIKMRQELSEKSKAGDLEATKQLEKLNSVIRNTQTEYKAQQRVLDGYSNAIKSNADKQNFANNSIQQNRDLLKQLTAQYIQLKNPSQQATDTIKKISDELKKQEAAIGNTSRNVGNYKESIVGAIGELKILGTSVSSVIDPLKNMGLGFQAAGGGVKGFASALALTGLPIIIAGITALVDIFSKYEPVAEAVERTTAGISAAFSALVRGNDIIEAGKQTAQLTGQLQELEDQQSLFDLNRARSRKEVIALLLESKNASKTLGEQLQATIKSVKLEKEENERQLENLRKQADLEEELFAVKVGIREKYTKQAGDNLLRQLIDTDDYRNENLKKQLGITSDEVNQLRKRRENIIEIEGESQNLQDRLANRTAAIIDKINAKREKDLADEKAQAEKSAKIKQDLIDKNKQNDFNIAQEQEKLRLEQLGKEQKEIDEIIRLREEGYKKQLDLQNKTSAEYLRKEEETKAEDVRITKAAQEAKFTAAETISKAFSALANAAGQDTAAGIAFNKAAAIAQIAIDTAKSISSGIAGATTSATATGPGAFVATPIFIATTIATIVSAIASATAILSKANTPAPPKFATGVIGLDGEGTETSDSIDARLSKGESVLTAKATKKFHRQLAMMEMSVGNKPNYQFGNGMFATGFIPSDGGFVARSIAREADNAITANVMEQILQRLPTPTLSIVEFQAKQDSRNRSVKVSEA